jgi:membrane protein YdbS with pleckstrin-like domain
VADTPITYSQPLRQSIAVVALRIGLLQVVVGILGVLTISILGWLIDSRALLVNLLGIASIIYQTADAALVIIIVLQWLHTSYVITPQEVIITKGILNLQTTRYKSDKIVGVKIKQSFLGKLFNYGTLIFHSNDFDQDASIVNIPDPYRWSDIIRQIKSKE